MKIFLTEDKKQKIITEKWSISDKIDDGINLVLNTISKDYINAKCYKIDNGLWLYKNEGIDSEIFGLKFILKYFYYFAINSDLCQLAYEYGERLNGYDEENKTLYVTVYSINGSIQAHYSMKNIVHETEHMLQIYYGLTNNTNYRKLTSDAYDFANKKIREQNFKNYEEQVIAYLVYYSDSHEQDAFVNEYYKEIWSNITVLTLHNSELDTILKYYKIYIEQFNNSIDSNDNLLQALLEYKKFGYNQTNFSIMLKKQLHRLEKKMNNVRKHFSYVNEINKHGVRTLPSHNLPLFLD